MKKLHYLNSQKRSFRQLNWQKIRLGNYTNEKEVEVAAEVEVRAPATMFTFATFAAMNFVDRKFCAIIYIVIINCQVVALIATNIFTIQRF